MDKKLLFVEENDAPSNTIKKNQKKNHISNSFSHFSIQPSFRDTFPLFYTSTFIVKISILSQYFI